MMCRLSRSSGLVSHCLAGIFFSLASTGVGAQDEPQPSAWSAVKNAVTGIPKNGRLDAYLSFHAHHNRSTYSSKQLRRLDEDTWGLGAGWTLVNDKGNEESLHVLVNRDSHRNLQWSAGYSYQWIFPVVGNRLHVGAGLSAVVIRREDWFDGVPFPTILPVFSIGSHELKLVGTYVPRVSVGKGKGDVLMLLLRASL